MIMLVPMMLPVSRSSSTNMYIRSRGSSRRSAKLRRLRAILVAIESRSAGRLNEWTSRASLSTAGTSSVRIWRMTNINGSGEEGEESNRTVGFDQASVSAWVRAMARSRISNTGSNCPGSITPTGGRNLTWYGPCPQRNAITPSSKR